MNLRSLLGHLRNLSLNDFELTLPLFNLEVDHSDLLLFGANGLLSFLEAVLLDVALLVVDAQLIISIDQLNTHVVPALASHFILVDEVVHLLLKRVNDQVKFVAFIYLLPDDRLLLLVDEILFVQLSTERVTQVDFFLDLMLDVNERAIFF
jgi:hypothetical protein